MLPMIVLVVELRAAPRHEADLLGAGMQDARDSMSNEPGCVRFDVVQDTEDAGHIWFYEVYRDQAALDAHRTMPHFKTWRATPTEWFAQPSRVSVCESRVMEAPKAG
jgi:quinol monooxygenase YgiN